MSKLRINKYVQRYCGLSRRQADKLIKNGEVRIDDRLAKLGEIIDTKKQNVYVRGEKIVPSELCYEYIVLNKPTGYICSRRGDRTVFQLLPKKYAHLNYVGRLDVNTTGALLFTNNGDLTNRLLRSNIPRVYEIVLDCAIPDDAGAVLKNGPLLDGRKVNVGNIQIDGEYVMLELYEGRWREVRRIFQALGSKVNKLHRLSFGPVSIDNLELGKYRKLTPQEIHELENFANRSENT